MKASLEKLKGRARLVKIELMALALAARHPGTPWYAKLIAAGCIAYAVTPVDFIPDAVPVIGLVDDLVFIPLAIALAARFVPAAVLADCRIRSREIDARLPRVGPVAWALLASAWLVAIALFSFAI
jgi:uncharacterized membrane protein YkvA (DUF1232 family)